MSQKSGKFVEKALSCTYSLCFSHFHFKIKKISLCSIYSNNSQVDWDNFEKYIHQEWIRSILFQFVQEVIAKKIYRPILAKMDVIFTIVEKPQDNKFHGEIKKKLKKPKQEMNIKLN